MGIGHAGSASQVPEHDVQADQAVFGVVEGRGDGADDLEPERLPQVHRRGVGRHDRVELDAGEARLAAPVQDVLPERAAGAPALAGRIDEERRRCRVRPAAGQLAPIFAEPTMTPSLTVTTVWPGGCSIHQGRASSSDCLSGKG